MSFLTGGSKQKSQSTSTSTSGNHAYDFLQNQFGGLTNAANDAYSSIKSLLGGDSTGFDNYKNMTGFNTILENGSRGITANGAAKGLLNSGATSKALVNYSNDQQNQYLQDYLNDLFNQLNIGYQAGNLISGAGQYGTSNSQSTSKGSSTGGLAALIGGSAQGAAAGRGGGQ